MYDVCVCVSLSTKIYRCFSKWQKNHYQNKRRLKHQRTASLATQNDVICSCKLNLKKYSLSKHVRTKQKHCVFLGIWFPFLFFLFRITWFVPSFRTKNTNLQHAARRTNNALPLLYEMFCVSWLYCCCCCCYRWCCSVALTIKFNFHLSLLVRERELSIHIYIFIRIRLRIHWTHPFYSTYGRSIKSS